MLLKLMYIMLHADVQRISLGLITMLTGMMTATIRSILL